MRIPDSRITGYDVARAVAVFGMVLVNFRIVMGAAGGPAWLQHTVGAFEGRAAATFVVLAGVGLSLLSRQARLSGLPEEVAPARARVLRRAAFLFVVGLLYVPLWPADILHFYGVYLGVAALMLTASKRRLIGSAVALVAAAPALLVLLDYEAGWNFETLDYSGFWTPAGMARHLLFNGFHPVVPWLAFVLVGMVLGRADLADSSVRVRVALLGAALVTIAEGMSRGLVAWVATTPMSATERADLTALFGTAPMPPTPLYMLAGTGTALLVIAGCVEVGRRFPDAAWVRALAATGQLALTLYVAHVVLGMGSLALVGALEDRTLSFSVAASAGFSVLGVVFASAWRARFARGPLEALMRRLTDG